VLTSARRIYLCISLTSTLLNLSFVATVSAADIQLRATEQPTTVFEWATQRCTDLFIPDSPARAFRRGDGSIVLIAAHYLNQFMIGPTFDRLQPYCSASSRGAESDDPAAFDTRYWIQALLPGPKGRIIGIASHEYSGLRHHTCAKTAPGSLCWYSSIIEVTSQEYQLQFSFASKFDDRFVAAPPRQYDSTNLGRYGFITTSNAVIRGGWTYIFVWAELGGKAGNCLFRAPLYDTSGNWTAYVDGSFSKHFGNPYEARNPSARCDLIAPNQLRGQLRSLININGKWVGVFDTRPPAPQPPGVYYSTSIDLMSWSEPSLLYEAQTWYGGTGCGLFFGYPSLIDHSSRSPIFDTGGQDLYLYLTRMNWADCKKGLNRDLVRIPIKVLSN